MFTNGGIIMSKCDLKIIEIKPATLEWFKNQWLYCKWQCHGIPEEVNHIVVMMDANTGDLIDYDLCSKSDTAIGGAGWNDRDDDNWAIDAGAALSALFDDALANHVIVNDDPQLIGPLLIY
jgi:hypothetical protein